MSCLSPYLTKGYGYVPCGKCYPCLEKRQAQWVFRLTQEIKRSSSMHFVNLDYAPGHVPVTPNHFLTLSVRDCQLFIKRLRKLAKTKGIKYYLAGEYGKKGTRRPHYHAIIFNCPDPMLYEKAWGKGHVVLGDANPSTFSYTAGYIMKGKVVPEHDRDDRKREFALMSKGLGDAYVSDEAYFKYHMEDLQRTFVTEPSGRKIPMPRYYKQKIYVENGLDMSVVNEIVQDKMREQEKRRENEYWKQNPDGSHIQYMSIKEQRRRAHTENVNKQIQQKLKL